jgi:type III restriction enzyme
MDDLRDKEGAKIECGKAHFKALELREAPAKYIVARTVDDIFAGKGRASN